MWLVITDFLVQESFVHVSQVTVFLLTSNKNQCYSLLCNFFCLYEWKGVTPLKVRALRKGYPVYFRLRQHSELKAKEYKG